MLAKKRFLILPTFLIGILALFLILTAGIVTAGSISDGNGLTLTVPDSYMSCEASSDQVVLSGVPDGSTAEIKVFRFFPDNSSQLLASTGQVSPDNGTLLLTVDYPPVDQWDLNPDTGERSIVLAAQAAVYNADGSTKKLGKKWTVTCKKEEPTKTPTPKPPTPTPTPKPPTPTPTPKPPTPTPTPKTGEGCTPGFWRQEHHFDSWVNYSPSDDFEAVFGVDASFDPHTLLDAVWLGGGGENALARHAVAALLNATNDVDYAYSAAEVISMVQSAYASGDFETVKDQFEAENEAGCPLD